MATVNLQGRVTSILSRDEKSTETIGRIAREGPNPTGESFPFWGNFATGVAKNETLKLQGEWVTHSRWGRTLKVSAIERQAPTTVEGEVAFLSGYIKGMTPKQARLLIDACGGLNGLIKVCKETPAKLDELLPKAKKVRSRLRLANWDPKLMDLGGFVSLRSAGLRANQVQRLVHHFGAPGLRQIAQQNPYEFCQVDQVGFASAEKVAEFYAKEQGRAFDIFHPDRLVYGIREVVGEQRGKGHVCAPSADIIKAAIKKLKLPRGEKSTKALEEALATALQRRLVVKDFDMIYTRGLHKAEQDVATHLGKLLASGFKPLAQSQAILRRDLEGSGLSDEQKEAVLKMAVSPVSLLTGGPGRGKTRTLKTFIDLLMKYHRRVLCLAPTGKAAKRASEVTGQPCYTIHKACGLDKEEDVNDRKYGRKLERRDRIVEDVIIVDETSMVDLALGFELVRRIKAGRSAVVFVGDPDQLPPVSAGQILKDLIASEKVPLARLTQVFRQANGSPIVDGADALNTGRVPIFLPDGYEVRLFDPTTAKKHPGSEDDEAAIAFEVTTILTWLTKAIDKYAVDQKINPVRDIQVYAPQKNGPLGLEVINRHMQAHLNPSRGNDGPKVATGFVVRTGDKVMQIKNNYRLRTVSSPEPVTVMNGQVGYVTKIGPERVEVTYDDVPAPVLYQCSEEFRQLSPAYAMSIHRSQGSETPYAFVILHRSMNPGLVNRALIYTGWTRAKTGVAVFGSLEDVKRAAENMSGADRYTNLAKRLGQVVGPVKGTRLRLPAKKPADKPAES